MKKGFFYIPALAVLAIACQKMENNPAPNTEEPIPEVKMITETVSGNRGASTKATISNTNASFAWTAGDNLAVHVSNGDSHKYVVTSKGADAAAASAKFTVEYEKGYSRDAFAVFPSNLVSTIAANYGQIGHTLDVTLPGSYTLTQVQGEVSPCPMIATNEPGAGWDFYQLCGLLRLTVNDIPTEAKRLEIDFNGKKVCGDFSIASPVIPNTSNIDTADDATNDYISVTKDGTDALLGETSLTINIPLPAGTYNKISVIAYDEISGGNAISAGFVPFARSVDHTNATKKATTLGPLLGSFTLTFKDKDTGNNLSGLRFVRLFSCQNKLYNGETTFGPYTNSRATEAGDMDNPIEATLKFAPDADDQLAFQVVDASGKVYSGLYDVFAKGYSSSMTVDVKAYTFTVASGKKVYFSPGDLGIDNGVYSFTEPFTKWNEPCTDKAVPSTRTWFDRDEVQNGMSLYGISWRIQSYSNPNEWMNIVGRTIDEGKVQPYYRVNIGSNSYCLLLPPDETVLEDLESDLKAEDAVKTVTNYQHYLAKGFVLLINTGYVMRYSTTGTWKSYDSTQGRYWASYNPSNKTHFSFGSFNPDMQQPNAGGQWRIHTRYIHNVAP